jgi:hypothetical protein
MNLIDPVQVNVNTEHASIVVKRQCHARSERARLTSLEKQIVDSISSNNGIIGE